MIITLQPDEPMAVRLQRHAASLQVSFEDLVYRFLDTQLQNETELVEQKQHSTPESTSFMQEWGDEAWDEDEWDEDAEWDDEPWTEEDERALEEIRAKARSRAAKLDLEIEEEIRREYGTGLDLLYSTAGMLGKGLEPGLVQYIVESPELSQQSLWLVSQEER